MMTVPKAFRIIIASILGFGVFGGALGTALGVFAPGYYRSVFRAGQAVDFEPVQVGLGLGITQGVIGGALVGIAVVLAVVWFQSRTAGKQ